MKRRNGRCSFLFSTRNGANTIFLLSILFLIRSLSNGGVVCDDGKNENTNNHAILVDASRFWYNYRHAANTLAIYKTIKRLGVPDENIVLMVADDYACNSRNARQGEIYTDDHGYENNVYLDDIEIDYRGDEVTPENVLRVLLDAYSGVDDEDENMERTSLPNSKRLRTNENSNVLFYLTGHGGDEFLKFQDQKEITSQDLQDAFAKMREMKRYKELLFVVDTCQAGTMFKRFNGLRNIIAIASSQKGENSYAHGVRSDIGLAVSDRFTRFLYEYLKRPNSEKIQLKELFAQAESAQVRAYLMSTVQTDWSNYGDEGRNIDSITVGDFFANNAELIDVKKVDIKETYATILPGFAKSASFVVIDV
jgi:GPI-anchor transamidase subunit K